MRFKAKYGRILAVLIVTVLTGGMIRGSTTDASVQSGKFNMSYIYFGDSSTYTSYVDNTNGSLNDISPSYFDLNADGSLKLNGSVSRKFVQEMHDRGIQVTPFLSNHWDRQIGINALYNRENLSDQLAQAVIEYNLDGINVDIENVTENEKALYTDLVRLLREKLPASKSVSVAVAPNPYGIKTGWHASFDFAGLAQYCDYLMLMTYDEHYQGSTAGAVAGYTFVENSIKAALKEVPADKLVLGIAFYGRYWKQGSGYGGYGISNKVVEELIRLYNGKVVYDGTSRSPVATVTIPGTGSTVQVFGKTLEAGTYEIWYENESSIKSKLELVQKYNLKGTGSWSLGQEASSTWDYYSLWLDSNYFSDIQKHWAKESILSVMNKGWMIGVSRYQFMPDAPVTRAQAAVALVRALELDTTSYNESTTTFRDTENHWARVEIEAAYRNGLIKGTGTGKFEPDQPLTRAQMAVMLDRVLKLDSNTTAVFYDVTPESSPWSYEAINRIAAEGLILGYTDGGFHPDEIMNRGQMAALLHRASSYLIQ